MEKNCELAIQGEKALKATTDLMCQFSLSATPNKVPILRRLLSYPYVNFVSQVFTRTREYEAGIFFCDICDKMLAEYPDACTKSETEKWNGYLVALRLCMYDYMNDWYAYISLYEAEYLSSYFHPNNARYRIIKRKYERLKSGATVNHLRRHEKERLPEAERKRRYLKLLNDFGN